MTMRRLALPVVAAVSASLALSGCSVLDSLRGDSSPTAVPAQTPPAGMEGTERFYAQQLTWSSCSGGKCASLEVPVDYADPSGATLKLALLKVPAASSSKRVGSLVVNPGGPGGSGVDYARAADQIVGSGVRRAYDVVGFDPRGVGRSAPIECLQPAQLDGFLGQDPTPDDASERTTFADHAKEFADACKAKDNPLLGHVSTVDAAKDMDILRSRLGDAQLNYLGKSYGTFLGATYAGMFPKLVGRFVLDGVVAPDLTSEEVNLGQAKGFELATRTWAEHCVQQGDCPLGSSVDQVMSGLRDFLRRTDAQPVPKTGDRSIPALTEGWASTGIAAAMYDQGMWDTLTEALREALAGDGSSLMGLANQYADRNPGGGYTSNLMQVIYAVNCLDKPESASLEEHEKEAADSTTVAPTWGPFLMWSSLPCGYWPVKPSAASAPHKISAAGSGPIVVVGTTRDPATPYEWSVRLRDQLSNAALVTYDGDGHTAYTRSNSCVDDAIDTYYLHGTTPQDGLRC